LKWRISRPLHVTGKYAGIPEMTAHSPHSARLEFWKLLPGGYVD
jgi:hypothetical protein